MIHQHINCREAAMADSRINMRTVCVLLERDNTYSYCAASDAAHLAYRKIVAA